MSIFPRNNALELETEFDNLVPMMTDGEKTEGMISDGDSDDSESEDETNVQQNFPSMNDASAVFGPSSDLLWSKRSRKGKVKLGKTAGCNLPPEIGDKLSQAQLHFANGDYPQAIELLSVVTRLAPQLPEPFHIMALIYEESGDKLRALQFFVLVAVHTPKRSDVWLKVCDLAIELKEYEQAVSALTHAMKRENSVHLYVKKILLLITMDHIYSARQLLKTFLLKFPEEILALADFGHACQIAGYVDVALNNYLRLAYHIMGSKDTNQQFLNTYGLIRNDHYGQDLEIADIDRLSFVIQQSVDILLEKSQNNYEHLNTVETIIQSLLEYFQRLRSSISLGSLIQPPKLSVEIALLYGLSKLYKREEPHVGIGLKMILPLLVQLRTADKLMRSNSSDQNSDQNIDRNKKSEEMILNTAESINENKNKTESENNLMILDEKNTKNENEPSSSSSSTSFSTSVPTTIQNSDEMTNLIPEIGSTVLEEEEDDLPMPLDLEEEDEMTYPEDENVVLNNEDIIPDPLPVINENENNNENDKNNENDNLFPTLDYDKKLLEKELEGAERSEHDSQTFLLRQRLRIAEELTHLGMNSMAERTASDVCAFLNGIKFSDAELISLWIRLGSIYEKTNKFDQALETYLKCIRADVDNPIPLYRFVSVSRIHRPTMSSHCINLLGMHFLTFLAEYESTRLIAISDAAMQAIIDQEDNEKRQIRTHNLHESIRAENGDLTNEQMLSAASKIMELEANPHLKNTFSFPENDVGVSRITRKRFIGRKRRKPQIKKSKKKEVPENKRRKNDKNGENESEGIEGMSSVDENGLGMQNDSNELNDKDGKKLNNSSQAGEIDDDFGFELLGEINEELEAEEGDGDGDDEDDGEEDGVGENEGGDEGEGEGGRDGDGDGLKGSTNDIEVGGGVRKKSKSEEDGTNGSDRIQSVETIDGGVEENIDEEKIQGEGEEKKKEKRTKKGAEYEDKTNKKNTKDKSDKGEETENEEGEGHRNSSKYSLGTKKYSRFTLENELRAIALWAIMLQETGDEMSFCCIMLPMISAWLINLRGGGYYLQGGTSRFRGRERTLEEFVHLTELQTNSVAVDFSQPDWFDATQGSVSRLVTAMCEYVSIEDVIGKGTLEEGVVKCQQYLEKLQMIGPDSTDTPEGSKYQQLLEKCAWIIKRRQSMPNSKKVVLTQPSDRAPKMISGTTDSEGMFRLDLQNTDNVGEFSEDFGPPHVLYSNYEQFFRSNSMAAGQRELLSDDDDEDKTACIRRTHMKRPAHCMEFVSMAMEVSKASGTAANVIVQHPHSIKYANSLSRAVLSADSKHGKRCSIEVLLPVHKLYSSYPTSLAATLLSGHDLAGRRKYNEAMGRYMDAFCMDTTQPLSSLVLATHVLFLSQHTLVKKRHETLVKSFGCLEQYKHSRLSVTKYCIGKGKPIPTTVIQPPRNISTSNTTSFSMNPSLLSISNGVSASSTKDGGNDKDDNNNNNTDNTKQLTIKNNGNSNNNKEANTKNKAVTKIAIVELEPETITDEALLQEVHFNYGKFFSELRLFHLAEKHFSLALAIVDANKFLRSNKFGEGDVDCSTKNGDTDGNNVLSKDTILNTKNKKNGGSNEKNENNNNSNNDNSKKLIATNNNNTVNKGNKVAEVPFSHLQLTRETAHNLVLIYKKAGAIDEALEIMQKYLVF